MCVLFFILRLKLTKNGYDSVHLPTRFKYCRNNRVLRLMLNFHVATKCKEENCDLKKVLDVTDKILNYTSSDNRKKISFAKLCIEDQIMFKCFFKLFSKNINTEVISDKDESFREKLDDLRSTGQEVTVIDNISSQEEFDNNLKDVFRKLKIKRSLLTNK